MIVTVVDKNFTILEDGIQNKISIDSEAKAPGPQNLFGTNGEAHNRRELSLTQAK